MRVPQRKTSKKPLWRHQIKIIKIWEKCHLKFLLRLCGPSFIKIGWKLWKLKTRTDAQTHTHTQTHRQGSSWDNIFSPEMTEYKNIGHRLRFRAKVMFHTWPSDSFLLCLSILYFGVGFSTYAHKWNNDPKVLIMHIFLLRVHWT